jgi:hypothetical protein
MLDFEPARKLTREYKARLNQGEDIESACIFIALTAAGLNLDMADIALAKRVLRDPFISDPIRYLSKGGLRIINPQGLKITGFEYILEILTSPEEFLQSFNLELQARERVQSIIFATENIDTKGGHAICVDPSSELNCMAEQGLYLVFDPIGSESEGEPWTYRETPEQIFQRATDLNVYISRNLLVTPIFLIGRD